MSRSAVSIPRAPAPALRDGLELLKPITWFPPIWAFVCGVVSSGEPLLANWLFILAGMALTGPLVCGTSQAVNDWFDRHVDAINEPHRPIPSGRVGGTWGLRVAILWTALSIILAASMGQWVLIATIVGLAAAWAYSAPPFRFKQSGWIGPLVVGFTYEGLSWFTGAAVMAASLPSAEILTVLALYSLGAFGIMTLNDFKAVEGDEQTGLRSLPVTLGVDKAARLACLVMALPQVIVVGLLWKWGLSVSAIIVSALLIAQCFAMPRLLRDPAQYAPWYNAAGIALYVLGMMAAALGLGGYI
ncbi:chlorophyll synthase ChlG [Altererythrobacter lutimaris]|uniref:Chlorophyll synthase ChlG n=1 Tax=Altererythrobacter lutimaris TaxID=2743979 RepID=A0A850HHZ9_9SPHN|nr:chlorophyll synthase ChlG [Altererythrobacter lutimaris]NVE94972.1 chlorophyll synthase ChlG [Altererythrobacter lutimaris]